MRFPVSVEERGAEFVATSLSDPRCSVRAATREEALQKIRKEIRHRVEECPFGSVDDDYVEVVIV